MIRSVILRMMLISLLVVTSFFQLAAQSALDSLRTLLESAEGNEKIDLRNVLSNEMISRNPQESMELANRSIKAAEASGYTDGQLIGLLIKTGLFTSQGGSGFDSAKWYLDKARPLFEKTNNPESKLGYRSVSGNFYTQQGQLAKGLEEYLEGLTLAVATGDKMREAALSQNVSISYQRLGNLEVAEEYILRAKQIFKEKGLKQALGRLLINQGLNEYRKNNLGKSIAYIEEALEILRPLDDKGKVALALQNLGFAYSLTDRVDEALRCYNEAVGILEELQDHITLTRVILNRARIWQAQKNTTKALMDANVALEKALTLKNTRSLQIIYLFLYELHEASGNSLKALENYKAYSKIKDGNTEKANQNRVEQLTAQFAFETKENELDANNQRLKNAEKEQRLLKSRQWVLAIFIVLLMVAIVLIILSYRSYVHSSVINQKYLSQKAGNIELSKENLTKELALKESNLKEYVERIQQKNTLIADVESQLEQLKEVGLAVKKENIVEMARTVERKVTRSTSWEEFRVKFDAVHGEFVTNLIERHEDLTATELEICILLKINLAYKQIAQALNVSYDSVKKSLQRLCYKLELSSNEELRVYVLKL